MRKPDFKRNTMLNHLHNDMGLSTQKIADMLGELNIKSPYSEALSISFNLGGGEK